MERKKSNKNKRLYIRLLGLIFISIFNSLSYAQKEIPNIKIEYSPLSPSTSDLLALKFEIDAKITEPISILLNDKNDFLILQQSKKYIERGHTIVLNTYKINKAGCLRLDNIFLLLGNKKILQPAIELNVTPPLLSKETLFRTKIFNNTHPPTEIKEGETLTLGTPYLLLIEGYFKIEKEQKINVECKVFDNFFIESAKIEDEKISSLEGWNIVYSSLLYPLKTGIQKLPSFNIFLHIDNIKDVSIILEDKLIEVNSENDTTSGDDKDKKAFQQNLQKHLQKENGDNKKDVKRTKMACEIKALREKEQRYFFYASIRKRRLDIEKDMQLKNSFEPFNYTWHLVYILIAIIIILLSFIFILVARNNKKTALNMFNILLFIIGLFLIFYRMLIADFREEYTLIDDTKKYYIYMSPSDSSSCIDEINLGETIKIIYKTAPWYFIEKNDTGVGWVKL